jgi:ribonuclease HI
MKLRAVIWIPGHAGITNTGNEKVDLLAKELPDLQRITQYAIPTMANVPHYKI